MSGILYIVATPIGNLDDITHRAINTLKEVDLIAAEDTRKTRRLLNRFNIGAKMVSYFEHQEQKRMETVLSALREGQNVALVSNAGTPTISDPGFKLVREAWKEGIRVIPIPGACAGIAALCASGLPTDMFTIVGFLPDKSGKRKKVLTKFVGYDFTLIFYVSPHKLFKTLQDMVDVLGGDRPAVIFREITKIYEERIEGSLDELLNQYWNKKLKGEITIVVSKA